MYRKGLESHPRRAIRRIHLEDLERRDLLTVVFQQNPVAIGNPSTSSVGIFSTVSDDPAEPRAKVWDNFTLSSSTQITSIDWSGSYNNIFNPNSSFRGETDFTIEVFGNAAGQPNLSNRLFNVTLDGGTAGRNDGADITETLVAGKTQSAGGAFVEYSADLTPFTLPAGTYWLSIVAVQTLPSPHPDDPGNENNSDAHLDPIWAWTFATDGDAQLYQFDSIFDPTEPGFRLTTECPGGKCDTAFTLNNDAAPPNNPPVARTDVFSTNEDIVLTGSVLSNNGNGADSDPDGDTLSISTTAVTAPSHGQLTLQSNGSFSYTPAGNYNGPDSFQYRLLDGKGGTATGTVNITVVAVNDPPDAKNDTFSTNEDTALNGNVLSNNGNGADSDPDGNTLVVVTTPVSSPAHGQLVLSSNGTFTYTPNSNFTGADSFVYRINDNQGGTDTATVSITVNAVNDPPIARNDNVTTNEDIAVSGNVLNDNGNGADSDPEGSTLTIETTPIAPPAHGQVTLQSNGSFTYTPTANYNGPDSFQYRLRDANGGTALGTVNISVNAVNDAPDAKNDTFTTPHNTVLNGNVLSNNGNGADSDIEGNTLSISTTPVTPPSHGALVLNANGTFSYTPTSGYSGPDQFVYTLTDGNGGSDTAQVNITVGAPVNSPPDAKNDSFTTNEDIQLAGNVLANNGNGTDSDADGDSLSVTVVSGPSSGALVLNISGAFTYTPNGNFNGADSFTYQLSDGRGGSDTATVSITVTAVNDIPVPRNDTFTTNEDVVLSGNVRSNNGNGADSDPDGDTISINTTPVSGPSHGALTLNIDGSFTYQPNANYNGPDSFVYTATDGKGGSANATVNISVTSVNDSPIAKNDTFTTSEDVAVSGNLLSDNGNGADSDAEGQTLSIATTPVTAPVSGVVVLNSNGTFTYTPNANFSGIDSFVYRVSDGQATANATVTINVTAVNDLPIAQDDTFSTNHGTVLTGNVLSNNGNGADSDADGDTLTVNTTPTVAPAHGSLTLGASGGFTYTPSAGFSGSDSFTYAITDGKGGSDTGVVRITVLSAANQAPIAKDDNVNTSEDNDLNGNVLSDNGNGADSDADGDTLSVTIGNAPAHGIVTLNPNGSFSYTPNKNFAGDDSFTYVLSDGEGNDIGTVNIVVRPVNDAPVAKDDDFTTSVATTVTGNLLLDNGNGADTDVDSATLTISTTPVSGPANGVLVLNSDGSFSYTPNAGFQGSDSFTYTVLDGSGGSDTGIASIRVNARGNASPIAVNDSFEVDEDGDLRRNVLLANGGAADSDPDNDRLSVSQLEAPLHGTLVLDSDGDFRYTPNQNYFGIDTFMYRLTDGQGGTDDAVVTIQVRPVNDLPILKSDSFVVQVDGALNGNVLADNGNGADSDIEGGLSGVVSTVAPAHGTLALNSDGTFSYAPTTGFVGEDSFTYQASDSDGASATAVVTILVQGTNNQAPIAVADAFTIGEDELLSGNVLADNGSGPDSDVDGDGLSVALVTEPEHGTLVLNDDGTFSYQPALDFYGADSFEYRLNDGRGGTATAVVAITVESANDSPVVVPDTFFVRGDEQVRGNVLADNGAGADQDPDGSGVTVLFPRARPLFGTITNNPDGSFVYTPIPGAVGTDTMRYVVVDADGDSEIGTFSITVKQAPIVLDFARNDGLETFEELTSLAVRILGDVSATLDANDLALADGSGNAVDLTGVSFSYDIATGWARWDFSAISVPKDVYTMILSASGIDGNSLALDGNDDGVAGDDYVQSVPVTFAGDVNLDGTVDFADFLLYAASFGAAEATWTSGDFNGDGMNGFEDFLQLATNFGKSVMDEVIESESTLPSDESPAPAAESASLDEPSSLDTATSVNSVDAFFASTNDDDLL